MGHIWVLWGLCAQKCECVYSKHIWLNKCAHPIVDWMVTQVEQRYIYMYTHQKYIYIHSLTQKHVTLIHITLHYTPLICSTLGTTQYGTMHCITVQYSTLHYTALRHCFALNDIALLHYHTYITIQYSAVHLHYVAVHYIVQHTLHQTIYCIALHYT